MENRAKYIIYIASLIAWMIIVMGFVVGWFASIVYVGMAILVGTASTISIIIAYNIVYLLKDYETN